MPSNTQIKIRYGMILEHCIAHALKDAGIPFDRTPQYEDMSEVPDFLIPNADEPKIVIECHQLGARNSLMMKSLRVLIAVSEAKRRFGSELIALSIVFGNLSRDFASSPVKALCAAFDDSILLQADKEHQAAVQRLESVALEFSKNLKITTEAAAVKVSRAVPEGMHSIKTLLTAKIQSVKLDIKMKSLWDLEAKQLFQSIDAKHLPPVSYWKKAILQSLFIQDSQFDDLLKNRNGKLEEETTRQLLTVGSAAITEEIHGDTLELDQSLSSLLERKDAMELRSAARSHLESSREMGHFFEDIRNAQRREQMANIFTQSVSAGPEHFLKRINECARLDVFSGIEHTRCWFADMLSLCSGKSFNHFNNLIFQSRSYPITLWCPYSHLVLRTSSFINNEKALLPTLKIAVDEFFRILKSEPESKSRCTAPWLSNAILRFRIDNAIKLRKVSPLVAAAEEICSSIGLTLERESLENLMFDVAADAGVGRFLVYVITDPVTGARGLFNAVAGYENPTDKAKEWAARCLALRYRLNTGNATLVDWKATVFLVDGAWSSKDILRLSRGGWQMIVGLDKLEDALRHSFQVKGDRKRIVKMSGIFSGEDDSAEDEGI